MIMIMTDYSTHLHMCVIYHRLLLYHAITLKPDDVRICRDFVVAFGILQKMLKISQIISFKETQMGPTPSCCSEIKKGKSGGSTHLVLLNKDAHQRETITE